jgi:predicted amidohydrolase YtcJ
MKKSVPAVLIASLAITALAACSPSTKEVLEPADKADLILIGKIYTGAGEPPVEAIAIEDGIVIYVGDGEWVEEFRGDDTQEIKLGEAVAYPGFVDGHAHLTAIGLREMTLNLEGTSSVADLQARIAEEISNQAPGAIIYGRGWIETGWPEGRFPNRDDLDDISPDNPVVVERADGHALLLNSVALEAVGIDQDTTNPEGGVIERDGDGRATGILIDNAMMLAAGLMEDLSPTRRREALQKGGEVYASRGWTGLHNMSVDWDDVVEMTDLSEEGALDLRVYNAVVPEALDILIAEGRQYSGNGRIITRAVKLYADGALGSRGAALKTPYADKPESLGLVLMNEEQALGFMEKAKTADVQAATHAIGDRGNQLVLDWYADVLGEDGTDRRWRIEHSQILDPADLPRFAAQGAIASMQPSHAIGDLHFAPARLGDDRLQGAYAWRSLIESGAIVVGGSDAPVEQGDPMIEFYAATARRDLQGFQGENWHAEEALSRSDALALFTSNAAFASFQEDRLGTLAVGKVADISVFSGDIMEIPLDDIPAVKAVMTIVDGEIIFDGR